MKLYAIAINTFREAIRDRILYLILAFAIVLILASRAISLLTVGSEEKIVKDLGLAAISLFGVATAIFVGVGLVFKEIEKRTIYTLTSKPIRRSQFILGKYLGLALVLLVNLSIMTLAFYLLLWMKGYLDANLWKAILLIFIELLLVTAFAIFFSSFSSPLLSSLFTVTVYLVGHLSWSLRLLEARVPSAGGKWVLEGLYRVLPNLEYLNVKGEVVHQIPVPGTDVAWAVLYGLSYTAVVLLAAAGIFRRRDFL
ncbi:MAG TPA: ABC transporter permease [Candidatus Saccharimonadales bacterium]|nr:ABC transporter permease [Candidatus Saccharimonadales bacterium]